MVRSLDGWDGMNFCVPHKGQGKGEKGTGIGGRTVGATSQRCTSQLAVCLKPLWDDVMSTRRKAPQTSQRDEGSLDTRGAWASGDPSSGRRGARHAWRERERVCVCVCVSERMAGDNNSKTNEHLLTFRHSPPSSIKNITAPSRRRRRVPSRRSSSLPRK